jgi:hypothetical protein
MTHHLFTIIAPIKRDRLSELKTFLALVEGMLPDRHPDLPFADLSELHFASLFVIEDDGDFEPTLVFESNIDGTIAAYIERLCDVAPTGLQTIFSSCRGYSEVPFHRAAMRAFLSAHVLQPNAAFVGNVGRAVGRIKDESILVSTIERRLDELVANGRLTSADSAYNDIRAAASRTQCWALQAQARLAPAELFKRRAAFAAVAGAAYLGWPITLPVLLLFIAVLRVHEMGDRSDVSVEADHVAAVSASEDKIGQNHFASVTVVKPGIFRRVTLRSVLFLINLAASLSVSGSLSELTNIHFAHWVLLDRGRRLLFVTNYDGSWENYLDDFIDRAAPGLTAIWSNVVNFPKTSFLVFGGARDERNFKRVARASQIRTNLWYSAYPTLAVPSIDNNSTIRDGLASAPRAAALDNWLQTL